MEAVSGIEALAERVSRGEPLSEADARVILDSHDLISVGAMADDVRRRLHGVRTTFVRVLQIHVDAPPPAVRVTAGECRIIGRPASVAIAVAAARAAADRAAEAPVTGFSLDDLLGLARTDGCSFSSLCGALRDAGLDGIAEVSVDHAEEVVSAVADARREGLTVLRLTVHAFDVDGRVAAAAGASALQKAAGGFRTFAPLPRTMSASEPSTGYDDVKQVALARLLVTNIDSIQVDWPLYGPKLAQVALTMGADDVDGVAAVDPGTLGVRRSAIEEIRGNIRAASQEPIERNARWETIAG